jgi:uncharacterized protein YhdP
MINRSWIWCKRIFVFALIAVVLAFAAFTLALRYWLLPNVGQYREWIAQQISKATDTRVTLEAVTGEWSGLRPRLRLSNIVIHDDKGRPALVLEQVSGALSWWALLLADVRFQRLEIERPVVAISRDASGKILIAGLALPQGDSNQSGFGEWLLKQGSVLVREATVSWQDATLSNAPLVLTKLTLQLDNSGNQHKFGLRATPPAEVAGPVDLRGNLSGAMLTDLSAWKGSLFAEVSEVNVQALQRYVRVPQELKAGRGGSRIWLEKTGNRIDSVTADMRLAQAVVQLKPELPQLAVGDLSGRVEFRDLAPGFEITAQGLGFDLANNRGRLAPGNFKVAYRPADKNVRERGSIKATGVDLASLRALSVALPIGDEVRAKLNQFAPSGKVSNLALDWTGAAGTPSAYSLQGAFDQLAVEPVGKLPGFSGISGSVDANQKGGSLALMSRAAVLKAPRIFADSVALDSLTSQARWKVSGEAVEVNLENVSFANADAAGAAYGVYRTLPSSPGYIDLNGKLSRGDGRAVWRYVPLVVDEKVRLWLKRAIVSATSEDVGLILRGDLHDFPFADDKNGVFQVAIKAKNGKLDYVEGWPKIENITADVTFRGKRMDIVGYSGRVLDTQLSKVRVAIPDLASHDEVVEISGDGAGGVQDGFRYIAESGVREMIHGFTDNFSGGGNGKLNLKIALPLRRRNETKIAGDFEFLNGSVYESKGGFPPMSQVTGHLQFTSNSVHANGLKVHTVGGPATISIANSKEGDVTIDAKGTATSESLQAVFRNEALKYLSGPVEWNATVSVHDKQRKMKIAATGTVLGGPAKLSLVNQDDGGTIFEGTGKASTEVLKRQIQHPALKHLAGDIDWKGRASVLDEKTTYNFSGSAALLGAPATFNVAGKPDGSTTIDVAGKTSVTALEQAFAAPPLLKHLSGSANWNAAVQVRNGKSQLSLRSDLIGMASDFPEPLRKTAAEKLPLQIDQTGAAGNDKLWRVKLGNIATGEVLAGENLKEEFTLRRGEVNFGGQAPAPQRDGLWLTGRLAALNLDDWRAVLTGNGEKKPDKQNAAAPLNVGGVDLAIAQMTVFGRGFTDFQISARSKSDGWQIALDGPELQGNVNWKPQDSGFISAQLRQLTIPGEVPAPGKAAQASSADDAPPARNVAPEHLPAMEIVAENFQLKNRKLGRLTLQAKQQGQDWRMENVSLKSAEMEFTADGLWQGWLKRPQSSMNLHLKVSDVGAFLGNIGYPKTVARGNAQMDGTLSWLGEPYAFNAPTTSGQFTFSAKSGQFLKVEPGVAKLLGLISLQALPRRITLDFRDIFSAGFAFDEITTSVNMNRGVLSTDNFIMRGPAAKVGMTGEASVADETAKLRVKVTPSLGAGVAVAGAIAGGPAAGAATYLVQKILRDPIDKIFAYEYDVNGRWDDPQVTKVPRKASEQKVIRR